MSWRHFPAHLYLGVSRRMLSHLQLSAAMQRAITLAQRGPQNDPNPPVGCVILDAHGTTVAEGYHRGSGTPHAEAMALAQLDTSLDVHTLTAVVTLEPCNHVGKTPPCAHALVDAGIGTVVYGQPDIGATSGGGANLLLEHNTIVVGGIETAATATLLAPWHARTHQRRATVIGKWAQSLDGRLAAQDGTSQWITSPAARQHVHLQRGLADVIVTTTATINADNPTLTARCSQHNLLIPPADQPIPVVFGRGDIAPDAAIHQHPALAHHGLASVPQFTGMDLAADLAALTELVPHPARIFLETGPRFLTAMLRADLVDELLVYTAPTLLGGPYHAVGELGVNTLAQRKDFTFTGVQRLGDDLVMTLRKEH